MRETSGKLQGPPGAAPALYRRSRPVGRQIKDLRRAVQPAPPGGELPLQHLAPEPGALPGREVGVLDGQLGQRRGLPRGKGAVERRQLAAEHPHGPAVGGDVVQREERQVLLARQPQQGDAQERPPHQVERPPRLLAQEPLRLPPALRRGETRQVDHRQRQRGRRGDPLHRNARRCGEDGAENLVAPRDLAQAAREGRGVEAALQVQGGRDVVGRVPRVELVEHPEALLREGERQVAAARDRPERGLRSGLSGSKRDLDLLRQGGHRAVVEEQHHRQLDACGGAQPGHHPGGRERVPAQLEEILVDPDPLAFQDLAPDPRHQLLDRRARRAAAGRGLGSDRAERPPVQLAVGGERKGLQEDERGRHHGIGQPRLQSRPKIGGARRRSLRHHVGHQAPARRLVAGEHHRLPHRGQCRKRRLDLAQLDADAAHLHLAVAAAEELDLAVRPVAREVAGAVEAGPGPLAERVGDEALRGQLRAVEIAARQARAGQADLARHADRHADEPRVEQVHPRIGDRTADRGEPPGGGGRLDGAAGRHHRPLRGAVVVDQEERQVARRPGAEPVAAGEHGAESQPRRQLLPQASLGERRRYEGQGDPLRRHPAQQVRRGAAHRLLRRVHARPRRQVGPQLPDRGVEGRPRQARRAVALRDRIDAAVPGHQVGEAAMGQPHPLRPAGRARGVDDVGEAVGIGPRRGLSVLPVPLIDTAGRVERQDREPGPPGRQPVAQPLLGEHDPGPRVLQHAGLALARARRIERQVRPARREHGEDPGRALDRGLHAHPHDRLRPHAEPAQPARQPGGLRAELPIGRRAPGRALGRRFRRPRRLRGELPVHRHLRNLGRGVVPGHQLPPLGSGEPGQQTDLPHRIVRDGGEQVDPVPQHALRGRCIEKVGRVLQRHGEAAVELGRGERQVELRPAQLERPGLDREAAEVEPRRRARETAECEAGQRLVLGPLRLLQHEHGAEEHRPAGVAHRLQPLGEQGERQVLVLQGREHRAPRLAEQRVEALSRVDRGAQRHRIDEVADHTCAAGSSAPCGGRADQQVALAGVAMEEDLEYREQQHVEGDTALAGEPPEPRGELRSETQSACATAVALDRGTRPVGRHVEERQLTGEPLQPVAP